MHFDLGLRESSLEGFSLGVMHIQWMQFPLLFISGEDCFLFFSPRFKLLSDPSKVDNRYIVCMNTTASWLFFVFMIYLSLYSQFKEKRFFGFHIGCLGQKERHKQCFYGMKDFWEL